MEATGRDGGAGGPSWSYRRRREVIGSSCYTISSSSRSGTIVSSTAYTSGASRLSSGIHMETALELDLELELRLGRPEPEKMDAEFAQPIKKPRKFTEETMKEMRIKHIESLVQEYFRAPSENRSILGGSGGGMSALERWFSELGVSWVLLLDVGGASERHPSAFERRSWVQALTQVMETIQGFVGLPTVISEEEVISGKQATTSLDPVQFALFFQKAITIMLVFVDVLFSKSLSSDLGSYLSIYKALFKASTPGIRLQFHWSNTAEVERIEKELVSLLSAKRDKAFDAIWSFMEERRTRALKSMEDSLGAEALQGSSDIHQATCSVMNHINFLLYNCREADSSFLCGAVNLRRKYVPPQTILEWEQPSVGMIAEMVSCLEEKLITKSQSFLDKGLGLLFLLNNSNFIREHLQDTLSRTEVHLAAIISSITCKVEHYTESYIHETWEPMLACLFNPTPLRLVRKYSPLSKFESEFQETYNTQKLWKVPDPALRTRLRKAVIQKIIPGYTKYIEDSKVTNPKFTPQELEEKLQELFEG